MPQLLLELFSEEIPARMQTQAGRDLARMAEERLKAAGLPYDSLKTYAGPRRLTLVVEGLPAAQADRERGDQGPARQCARTGAGRVPAQDRPHPRRPHRAGRGALRQPQPEGPPDAADRG